MECQALLISLGREGTGSCLLLLLLLLQFLLGLLETGFRLL